MAYDNPGFETEDSATTGYAEDWTASYTATGEEAATYGDGTTVPPGADTPVENFEGDWNQNEDFLFEYADPVDVLELEAALYDSILSYERFVWVPHLEDWGDVSSSAASYDAHTILDSDPETFVVDDGWILRLSNELGGPVDSDPIVANYAFVQADDHTAGPPPGYLPTGEQFRIITHYGTWVITLDDGDIDISYVAQAIRNQTGNEVFSDFSGVPARLYIHTLSSRPMGNRAFLRLEEIDPGVLTTKTGFDPSQIDVNHYGSGNVGLTSEATTEEMVDLFQGSSAFGPLGIGFSETPDHRVRIHSNPGGTIRVDSTGDLGDSLNFLSDVTVGPTGDPAEDYEDHEEGWLVSGFLATWDDVSGEAAFYDTTPQAFEDFEEEWRSNEDYITDWDDVTDQAATYDTGEAGASEAFEDFEEVKAPFDFSVVVATDDLTEVGHGLVDNQIVVLSNVGGQLPGGLHPNYTYFVKGAVADFFGVTETYGGASKVDILDTGIGAHYCTPDRSVFWTTLMVTL